MTDPSQDLTLVERLEHFKKHQRDEGDDYGAEVLHRAIEKINTLKRDYYELIWAVEKKYEEETRHETALRYIKERENQEGRVAMSNALLADTQEQLTKNR